MWTRRSQAELELYRRKRRTAFVQPTVWALVTFICMFLHSATNPGTKGMMPHLGTTVARALISSLLLSVAVGAICYVWQWYWGRNFIDQPTWICNNCHGVKRAGGDRSCECEGTFEDIEWWKWTDDDSTA